LTPMGASSSSLYSINLNTGAATLIGVIGGGALIRDIAIPITFIPSAQQAGFAVVNADSFSAGKRAPGMIVSDFGPYMTQNISDCCATSQSLPTTLGGVKVSVNGQDAGLFFAGPNQINLLVPDNLGGVLGAPAVFSITDNTGASRTGTVSINSAAPGIFTADSTGTGTAAGSPSTANHTTRHPPATARHVGLTPERDPARTSGCCSDPAWATRPPTLRAAPPP